MATIAEWIRAFPGKSNAEVARVIGCRRSYVTETRWRDKDPARARHKARVSYHKNKRLQAGEIPWTDEHLKFLRDNWPTMSSGEIAWKLGRSRNSIAGKAHRMGLEK